MNLTNLILWSAGIITAWIGAHNIDSIQRTILKAQAQRTQSQAEAMGLSHQCLSRLVEEEKIIRVGRGMYLHSEGILGGTLIIKWPAGSSAQNPSLVGSPPSSITI